MAWWKRKPKDVSPEAIDEALAELREAAHERIASGFWSRAGLAEELAEYRDDIELPDDVKLTLARTAVAEEWEARLALEATWTEPGDYARVQAAFDDLATQGIVGRMNFTCCQTCGNAEIDDERTPRSEADTAADGGYGFDEWGYTFFHQQDADRLADEPADLYLSYSAFRPPAGLDPELFDRAREGDDAAREQIIGESELAVGRLVAAALARQGLSVDWPEDTSQRILITGLHWRKPLPAG